MFLGYFGRFRLRSVSVAVQNDWTEPKGHFRSVFAVSTQKYGLARQSLDKNAYSKKGAMSVRCIQASACDDIDWE